MGAHVLVGPDSFKGTHDARTVAEALREGIERTADAVVDVCPVADGGEGTVDALLGDGVLRQVDTTDPLGRPISATYGLLDGGRTAVIECAAASGLPLVAPAERDATNASTAGTGILIADAVARGATRILVACGGSATTDGGHGALEALAEAGGIGGAELVVLTDVTTPYEWAAEVFGPQKGADQQEVERLTQRLHTLAASLPRDPRRVPRTGAAGGLAGGLWAAYGARLVSGAEYVLDALGIDARMRRASLVVTGEGRIDRQTFDGKLVGEVARRAAAAGVPCHAVVGQNGLSEADRSALGLAGISVASTIEEITEAGIRLGALQ